MNRIKAKLEGLGLTGIVGVGLLLFCIAFFFGNVLPLQEEVEKLSQEHTRLSAEVKSAVAQGRSGPGALTLADVPDLLKRLDGVAKQNGIVLGRGSYQLKATEGARRMEISLPLKAPYPALRTYLRQALALSPNGSVDELSLQREQATDPAVEVQIRFSFALAGAP